MHACMRVQTQTHGRAGGRAGGRVHAFTHVNCVGTYNVTNVAIADFGGWASKAGAQVCAYMHART